MKADPREPLYLRMRHYEEDRRAVAQLTGQLSIAATTMVSVVEDSLRQYGYLTSGERRTIQEILLRVRRIRLDRFRIARNGSNAVDCPGKVDL